MPTIESELTRLFPNGTRRVDAPHLPDWTAVPVLPADVFAAAAHLLEASGAYQYIVAPFSTTPPLDFGYAGPTFAPTQADLDHWCNVGADWRDDPNAGISVQPYWSGLWAVRAGELVVNPAARSAPPTWWTAAHALMVIADEASRDLGYFVPAGGSALGGNTLSWANAYSARLLASRTELRIISDPASLPGDDRHISRHVALDSLSLLADRHVARVLPKGRTTEMGCAPRTFSHNLALLPPHGRANAYWHQAQGNPGTSDDLDLLLVPFPYVLPQDSFRGLENLPTSKAGRWGRFRVDQRWLDPLGPPRPVPNPRWSTPSSTSSFVAFVDALLAEADAKGSLTNGILLPEYALDWETYDALVRHIRDAWPRIEFIVSGVSRDCNGRAENQVTFTIFTGISGQPKRYAQTHSRRKHHRWQIEKGQIEAYGLERELDADVLWWEHLAVEERVLHMDVFRQSSTLTAVICEDLARVDPGLALLRSLGASLVFALLMDGPQLKSRWPGTYATSLADDPGSSVLSMTSLALVDRSIALRRKRGHATSDRVVALWKNKPKPTFADPDRDFAELAVATGHHALAVKLRCEPAVDTTIDGRSNADAIAWYLRAHESIGLSSAKVIRGGWGWIVDGS